MTRGSDGRRDGSPRARRRATLQDVADAAGVSRAAASFALAGRAGVSEATRERILAAARELDYVANVGARNLRRSVAGAIGLVLPDHATGLSYYMDVAIGVVEAAQRSGRSVVLLARTPEAAASAHVDGFIVVDVQDDDPLAAAILAGRLPVVAGEPVASGMAAPAGVVRSGYGPATRALLEHLAERGARSLALLAPPVDTAWGRDVRAAHEAWASESGREARTIEIAFAPDPDAVVTHTRGLLREHPETDAILVVPDGAVAGVLTAARAAGRSVGDDLLVAACVDGVANRLFPAPVTAIDLRPREFGRACVELLESVLSGAVPDEPMPERSTTVELRIRESTAGRPA